jgi:hypothetical protein
MPNRYRKNNKGQSFMKVKKTCCVQYKTKVKNSPTKVGWTWIILGRVKIGNQHHKDRGGLLLKPQTSTITMRRRHVKVRVLISLIVVLTAYELLSADYGSVLRQEQSKLVSERRLPTGGDTGFEEEVNIPPGENTSILEYAPTRLLGVPEEANGPLRGGERQVSKEKGERERISGGGLVPLQGNEGEQTAGHIHDETKEHDAEKVYHKDEKRGNASDGVAVPQQGGVEQAGATHYRNNNTMICFVTSVFGRSVEKADKPPNVENIFPNDDTSEYEFLLFTNLKNLSSPGWTNIVLTDLPYRRFITQSRWGKFVGWRHKGLAHCGTVIYMDGYGTHRTVLFCSRH